jgi:hypothetical protein
MMDRTEDNISDLFKEVYGYRPREDTMSRIDAMTDSEYKAFVFGLREDLGKAIEEDSVYEAESIAEFNTRLLGMMADYEISMSDAMTWDFESFGRSIKEIFELGGDAYVEHELDHYLWQNGINDYHNAKFYIDLFMGRANDFVVKKD